MALTRRDVYIAYRYVPEIRRVQVGVQRADGIRRGDPAVVRDREVTRHESLLIDTVIDAVDEAQRDGVDVLVVRLSRQWFPKSLIQWGRAFRTVTLADRIECLHNQVARRRVQVVVAGPCVAPRELEELLDERCRSIGNARPQAGRSSRKAV